MENNKKLTGKEDLFVDEYMETFNATTSYIKAYNYTGPTKNASSLGYNVLKKDHIKKEIERRRAILREEHNLYMESIIEQLKRIVFTSPRDVVNVKNNVVVIEDTKDLPKGIWSSIKGIKEGKNGVEIEFHDKLKAIELLVKYAGLYNEKLDVNNKVSFDFSIFEGKTWEELEEIAGKGDWKENKKDE